VKVLASYNIKGGVGKTATAVNLAHLAAADGARVLVWDLDPQGAASFYFRVKPKVKGGGRGLVRGKRELDDAAKATDYDRLDLVPADFSYRNMDLELDATKKPTRRLAQLIRPLKRDYDYVFLDCPPSISLVSESVFEAADALVVPLIPTPLSVRTFVQLENFLSDSDWRRPPRVIGFFSMVDGRKALHRELIDEVTASHPEIVAPTIPAAIDVERMGVHRAPVTASAPKSRAAKAYRELWSVVSERIA
jgi:cellulose biosynthesis protein BcsQ